MEVLEEVIEMLQDMADVADTAGSAYLYRRNTPQVREMIDKLKVLNKNIVHMRKEENMPLLNYTTTIDVHKTLGEIQKILVSHGARKIMYDYSDDGHILALIFQIETPDGFKGIKLPSNVSAVYQILLHEPKCPKANRTYEQAERVAWRTIKDWVEAQMAILEWNMVKMDEIFLPYMLNNKGQTFFEAYQLKQLGDGS